MKAKAVAGMFGRNVIHRVKWNPPRLIMVMGVQRSGTNALFDSLATDKTLSAFPEDIDSVFYRDFRLRPVDETSDLIRSCPGRILLKPISETAARSLAEVAEEYRSYALRFVWIYRDPVNVLDSMRRLKWINAQDCERPDLFLGWRKRNEYALQFQQECPHQITIVRYEDLCLDPAVFRKLTRLLNLKCHSYFRGDTAQGRAHIAAAVQQRVDAATSKTLLALDAARTFKPRRIYAIKNRALRLHRLRTLAQPAAAQTRDADHAILLPSVDPRAPSELEGIFFWFCAPAGLPRQGPIETDVFEAGPHRMRAARVENGPYALRSLNSRTVLYYPHTKVKERRKGASGTLVFDAESGWDFFFDGSAFTIFALFRPNVPCYPPYDQQHSVLFRVGARDGGAPEFLVEWDGRSNRSGAVLSIGRDIGRAGVWTRPQSHLRQEWRIILIQRSDVSEGKLSISTQGDVQDFTLLSSGQKEVSRLALALELGGSEKERLFYGEVSDLIIFRRPLTGEERSAVIQFLTKTYQL